MKRTDRMTVKRICAGHYMVTRTRRNQPDYKVAVTQVVYPNDGTYWIAAANWDRLLMTDPLPRKSDAVFNAKHMLSEI
jgi:hypothetical protein